MTVPAGGKWRGWSFCTVVLGLLLNGCAVGPDFVRPAAPAVGRYTGRELPGSLAPGTGEPGQRFVIGQEITAEWWELFGSPQLTEVVRRAIAGNQTVAAARSTLAQAEDALLQRGGLAWSFFDGLLHGDSLGCQLSGACRTRPAPPGDRKTLIQSDFVHPCRVYSAPECGVNPAVSAGAKRDYQSLHKRREPPCNRLR